MFRAEQSRLPLITIFFISTISLAYEVLLTRVLSVVQWHHFAYMIISIALLGYGASGAFLTLIQKHINQHFPALFVGCIFLFAISGICGIFLLQIIPINPLELLWDYTQWFGLSLNYVFLMLPFFFAANCLGLVFYQYKNKINISYSADLLGASIGALGVVFLLNWFFVEVVLQIITSMAGIVAVIAVMELKLSRKIVIYALFIISFPWLIPGSVLDLQPSEYKSLAQAKNINGSQIIYEKSNILAELSVIENQNIPFRYAPGLSINSIDFPQNQLGVFFDADSMSVVTQFDGNTNKLFYMDYMTSALPYHIINNPLVLVLGAGGGMDILQALYFNPAHIDAVELNEQTIKLLKNELAEYSGNIYNLNHVNVYTNEARAFVQTSKKHYDLIQLALMDSFSTSSAGLHALNENYLYTLEALMLYITRLSNDGVLAITRWIKLPPRDTLKLFNTAIEALQKLGIKNPEQHIVLIRSWNTSTLIVKKQPMTVSNLSSIKEFAHNRSFDLAYYPGITSDEVNQFNVLPEPYFYNGTIALLSNSKNQFTENYKYKLQPATDNKPYFFNFLKWQFIPEILQLPAKQGLPLLEWGTIILFFTFTQAIIASILFILLPLWLCLRKSVGASNKKIKSFTLGYFLLLGVAFMFIEIAFIQRFILYLSHPSYAVAVVLTGFLLFAGLGSGFCKRLPAKRAILYAISGIVLTTGIYLLFLQEIFTWSINSSEFVKILISLILIAPLAFFMGMPFPQGLSLLARITPKLIPWAWGINGCASVVSAVLATIIAIHFGFTIVIALSLLAYTLAGILFWTAAKRI